MMIKMKTKNKMNFINRVYNSICSRMMNEMKMRMSMKKMIRQFRSMMVNNNSHNNKMKNSEA